MSGRKAVRSAWMIWVIAGLAGLSATCPCRSTEVAAASAAVPECRISLPVTPRRIPPEIYGLAAAPQNLQTNACVPLIRWGGNTTSRYNWRLDVWNASAQVANDVL